MRLLEMVAHRGQQRHRRRLDQLRRGAGALDGQRIRARHDGGGVARAAAHPQGDTARVVACRFKEEPRSARGSCHTLTSCTAPEIRSHVGSRRGSRTYCRVSSGRERRTIHSAAQIVRYMLEE